MIDTTPTPLFLNENPVAVPIPKAVQQAYVWAFGGVAALLLLVFAVATQSNADAARITGLQDGATSAPAALVSAFAVAHGRPGAF